jgi:site-specific recombinase XerD
MKPTDFALHLTAFLTNYLPAQRNASPNTVKAYRDAFVLLLRYCRDARGLAPERLALKQIDPPLVLGFLDHLEKDRGCSARTRNLRLTALHSFFRYLQAEDPSLLLPCQRILAIPLQRQAGSPVDYLSPASLAAILRQPDLTRRAGRRDAVLLSLLYDTGTRVQELINLSVRDVRLASPSQIRVTGKGRKTRIVPLMDSTVALLRGYVEEQGLTDPEHMDKPLFPNRRGGRLSRSGVRYLVAKYTERAGAAEAGLALPTVSPHTFRHSKAMHLLQSGNPLVVIRDFLGHADLKSTEVYARSDLDMKRQALDKAREKSPTLAIPSWTKDESLLDWLSSL